MAGTHRRITMSDRRYGKKISSKLNFHIKASRMFRYVQNAPEHSNFIFQQTVYELDLFLPYLDERVRQARRKLLEV